MNNKGSKYGLKGFQLKNIIEQYNQKFPEKEITGYKSKTIKNLDDLIKNNKIKIEHYNIVDLNPYSASNIFKKAGINQYNADEQNLYLEELEKNKRYLNPLQPLTKYTNKEGKQEYLTPQEHQKQFVSQFIYSSLRGAIMFHGVGSGKTLTAVISSHYYLKMYPNNKVIVISPSALLFNFVAGMIQYGLDKNDNRYSFFTYDKYNRNPKIAKDSLLIVDEAHNFRTEMKFRDIKDPETNDIIDTEAKTNVKGHKIMKWGSSYCHKILLLTGTAFVNVIYDIENLLAMIDNRKPVDRTAYDDIMSKVENVKDYFDYKISYFKTSNKDDLFPERIEKIIPIYMTEQQEQKYNNLRNEGNPNNHSAYPNSFYSAEKYASNMIDNRNNPKTEFIIKEITNKSNQKFIIYSGLYDTGIINITEELKRKNIKFKMITGKQNTIQKNESKFYFNYYNVKQNNFFDTDTIDKQYHRFINDDYRILLITKAGAEGVDTINCQNIILLDGQWNDALTEQIIARAIRYKSHHGLPKKERYVNVSKCIFCFQSNKKIIEDINKGKVDFNMLKKQITESTAEELKLLKGSDKRYLPTIKELKNLKINNKLFIPEITEFTKVRGRYGREGQTIKTSEDGWDVYSLLQTELKKKEWRKMMYYRWLVATKKSRTNKFHNFN